MLSLPCKPDKPTRKIKVTLKRNLNFEREMEILFCFGFSLGLSLHQWECEQNSEPFLEIQSLFLSPVFCVGALNNSLGKYTHYL